MRNPSNRWVLVISIVLMSIVVISCGGGGGGGGFGVTGRTDGKKVYLRDEFKSLVLFKTKDEVLKAVGKPDTTQESGDMIFWYYNGITKDPITDKIDFHVQVVFEKTRDYSMKVMHVNY